MLGPNHEHFKSEARKGRAFGEAYIAARLTFEGLPAKLEPLELAETPWEKHRFRGQRDVRVKGFQIEVKSSSYEFTTDITKWPFGEAFVIDLNRWDTMKEKPLAVVFVSQVNHATLFVWAQPELWWVKRIYDTREERQRSKLEICARKADLKQWSELVKALKEAA